MDFFKRSKENNVSYRWGILGSLIAFLFFVSLVVYIIVSYSSGAKESEEEVKSFAGLRGRVYPVEVQEVEVGKMSKVLNSIGTLVAYQSVDIKTDMPGRVKKILFSDGFLVKKDEILIEFEDDLQKAKLKQAEANYALNKAKFDRTQELHGKQYTSAKDKDKDLAELKQSEAQLDIARVELAKTKLIAPFDGGVGIMKNISVGSYVQPNTDIVTLVNLNPIKVDFKIPGAYLKAIQVGQKVKISVDGYDGESVEGEIEAIDSKVDAVGHGLVLRAKITSQDGTLKPGLFARVSVVIGENPKSLIIPEKALERNGNEEFVLVVANGTAAKKQVITGVKENGRVEILKGLRAKEQVIISGQQTVRDGYPVSVSKSISSTFNKK